MKAVIIAGGLGTRLRPLTYNTPKPIVLVANRPFIVHQIEHLKQHGIKEIILNLHYLPDMIQNVLGDGSEFGVKIYYSIEREPMGTAGAVKNAEKFFDNEPLVVFNGDILTDINVSKVVELHKKKKAKATLTLTTVEDPTPYGLVLMDENQRVCEFMEKPSWERLEGISAREINAGIYVLDPSVFKDVPSDAPSMFERDLFPKLLQRGEPIYGYISKRYWIDIGNIRKYRMAHEAILKGEVAVRICGSREDRMFWVGEGAQIAKNVKIFGNVIAGKRVKIGESCVIQDYTVVGENVSIGKGSKVENSIIWDGSYLGENVRISHSIIGYNCRIEDGCFIKGAVLADNTVITKGSIIDA